MVSTAAGSLPTQSGLRAPELRARTWQHWEAPFIIFVLLVSIALRLIHITEPFVDSWSWKQLTNAMVARNYYLHGYHFFYPQIDWAGPYAGYIGTEFPTVPFLAALLYRVFGVHEWVGRSVSVAFFAAGAPFLYLLVRKISTTRSAAIAFAAYCMAPLTFFASRSFQSDTASVSFCIIAFYLTTEWLDNPSSRSLFLLASATTSLGIATKLPQLIIGVPILYLCWDKYGIGLFRRRALWAFAAVALLLPLVWEVHAYHISVTYYPYHFAGEKGIGIRNWQFYRHILWKTVTFSLTPVLTAALIAGVPVRSRTRYGQVFHWWLVAFVVFFIFAARENRHPWVQMPLVPIAAAFLGILFDKAMRTTGRLANSRIAFATACMLVFLPFTYLSYKAVKRHYRPWQEPDYKAALEIARLSPPNALILAVDEGEPAMIYYSQRKGWHFLSHFGALPRDSAEAISELEKYRGFGASYIVFDRYNLYWLDRYKDFQRHLDSHYKRVRETPDYIIFELKPALGALTRMRPRRTLLLRSALRTSMDKPLKETAHPDGIGGVERKQELKVLRDPWVREAIMPMGIELCSFVKGTEEQGSGQEQLA
jgi:4-amino-4-deoxy-L-arabinose transferase-like glycosyltransferase